MIRAILLEDNPDAVEVLQIHFQSLSDLGQITDHFASVADFLEAQKQGRINERDFDLLLLDIELKGSISGYEFLENNPNFSKPVVVVSGYPDKYGLKGYKYQISDFLPKPIGQEDLKNCLLRINSSLIGSSDSPPKFPIQTGATTFFLDLEDIILFRMERNYCYYFTPENPPRDLLEEGLGTDFRFRITLKELEAKLPSNQFLKVSENMLVNTLYIHRHSKKEIEIRHKASDGKTKPYTINLTSDTRKASVTEKLKRLFKL